MNTAILWDIENVTPPAGSDYIQTIVDTVSENGKISYAMAFGNWSRDSFKTIAGELASANFELIHLPKSKKNSADMSLIAHGVELIFQYPHIARYVLISGDADFRPLLHSMRKYGKETWVICDVKNNASEELLNMADKFTDYREMIGRDDENEDSADQHEESAEITKEQSFELFREAIGIMFREGKKPNHGSVKIKMKLLNDRFNEGSLGYKTWNAFVTDAIGNTGNIRLDATTKLFSIGDLKGPEVPEVFKLLMQNLQYSKEWALFSEMGPRINYKKYGFNQFLKLALDAEKRGYIILKNEKGAWSMKLNSDYPPSDT